jgi:putative ATPase
VLQETMALYDKNGEQHYDIISAFIKSMRGVILMELFIGWRE